jgi:hypothetical protein
MQTITIGRFGSSASVASSKSPMVQTRSATPNATPGVGHMDAAKIVMRHVQPDRSGVMGKLF